MVRPRFQPRAVLLLAGLVTVGGGSVASPGQTPGRVDPLLRTMALAMLLGLLLLGVALIGFAWLMARWVRRRARSGSRRARRPLGPSDWDPQPWMAAEEPGAATETGNAGDG